MFFVTSTYLLQGFWAVPGQHGVPERGAVQHVGADEAEQRLGRGDHALLHQQSDLLKSEML